MKIYWKDYPLEKDKTWEPYLEMKTSVPFLVNQYLKENNLIETTKKGIVCLESIVDSK